MSDILYVMSSRAHIPWAFRLAAAGRVQRELERPMMKLNSTRRTAALAGAATVACLLLGGATPVLAREAAPVAAPVAAPHALSLETRVRALARSPTAQGGGDAAAAEQEALSMMHRFIDAAEKDPSAIMMVHLVVMSSEGDPKAQAALHAAMASYHGAGQ
jgi:hypothetical protein